MLSEHGIIFPLVLPEDSEVARTRKRGECGSHKKTLWLAFLSSSDKIKSKSINFLSRNFHCCVFNPIPSASILSPQLQPYPRSFILSLQLQPYPHSFNPICTASILSPHLQPYPHSFNPIPAASTISLQLQPYPHSFNPIPGASTLSLQLQPYPCSFNPIPAASTLSPQLQSELNYWLVATHWRQSLDEALESQIVFWYLQATFLTLFWKFCNESNKLISFV